MAVCPDGHQSTATDFCDTCGMRIEGAPSGSAAAAGGLSADVRSAAGVAAAGPGSAAGAGGAAEQCPQCGTERSGQFCEVCGYDYATGAAARPAAPVSFGSVPAAPAMPAVATPTLAAATPAPATIGSATPGPATPDPTPATTPPSPGLTPPSPGLTPPGPGTNSALPASATFHADPTQTGLAGAALAWSAVITADRAYYDSVIAAGGPDAASIQFPSYCPERRFQLTGREMRIGRRSASRGLEPEIDLTGPPADPGVSHLHAVLIAQANGTWSVLDPGSSNGTQVNGADIAAGVPVPLHDGDQILLGAWTRLTIEAS